MSVGRYPAYKPSGVEWIDDVPENWRVVPLKRIIDFTTGWTPPTGQDELYVGDNLWATIRDITGKVLTDTENRISNEAVIASRIKASPAGSLLFSFKLSIGHVAFAGCDLFTNEAIATFQKTTEIDLDFAYYAFPLFIVENAAENIYGAKLLNQELIRNAILVLPSVAEQRAIAAFLDRETAKIDALIAEQERLIALLQEKRQAVISQAVTKGLDPTVPMEDSGFEWLGMVPKHWAVTRFGNLVQDIKAGPFGSAITKDVYVHSGYRVYGQEQVIPGNFSIGDYYIDEEKYQELKNYAVCAGDILISCVGTFGKIAIVPPGIEPGIINPRLIRVRFRPNVMPEYAQIILKSPIAFNQLSMLSRGGTMDVINIGTLKCLVLPIPSLDEQQKICTFVSFAEKRMQSLVDDTCKAIALLGERRAALISAVVTGKIDVRYTAASEPAAA